MSIALTGANPLANTRDLSDRVLRAPVPTVSDTSSGAAWVRNPSWLTLTPPGTSDEKFVGLHAVWPDANFLALSAAGNYTVDWGDGSATQDFSSGVVAYKEYDFADADLVNTNAPVTFTASTDTVNRTAHGYSNGNRVSFYNIVTTTGLNEAQSYYVINAAADTFQVSETEGGSAVALTNDGSATLLPYKQVIVQVYPQAGQSLTQLYLNQKHNQTGLQAYASGFLDVAVAGANLTDLRVAGSPGTSTQNINFNLLERVNLVRTDCRQLENLFLNCVSLQKIVDIATSTTAADLNLAVTFTDAGDLVGATAHGFRNGDSVVFSAVNTTTGITAGTRYFVINANANDFQVSTSYGGSAAALTTDGTGTAIRGTSMAGMFSSCSSLSDVTLFDTSSVTAMNSMFSSCRSLKIVPLFDTSSVTNMQSMFNNSGALTTVPLFNTASVTNMSSMFSSCFSLETVPLFNTASVTNMSSMFQQSYSLITVPLFNTASVTNMSSLFRFCYSLTAVPLFNTASVTNMDSMFNGCGSLTAVPLFNTASVTNMTSMFNGCRALTTVPLFNTASVTNMSGMFDSCVSLTTVPLFNTASVTNMSTMFQRCSSLTTVPLFNTASVTNMSSMFFSGGSVIAGCVALTTVPLFNTASVTNMSNMFRDCLSLRSVPLFNTASVTDMSGMFNTCSALTSVPLFNTASVTNMSGMFGGCRILQTVPLLNTASVTNTNNMFGTSTSDGSGFACVSLTTVPLFNTAAVTNMGFMFNGASQLQTIPLFNTAAVTNFSQMFGFCSALSSVPALNCSAVTSSGNLSAMLSSNPSLSSIKATGFKFTFSIGSCKLSKARLEEVFDNLNTFGSGTFGSSQTITVTSNYGVGTNTSKASLSLTAGSTTITMADTSGVTTGMYVTGTGTGITTGRTVVSDVSANTLTLTAHGLPNDTPVSFSSLGSTTGVSNGVIYYVVNANTDDFQISLTVGGAAIDLTGTGGNMTLRYPSFVTGVTTNTSVTIDTPLASTGTQTLTFRDLDASAAMLKGWAVTF